MIALCHDDDDGGDSNDDNDDDGEFDVQTDEDYYER